MQRSIGQRQGFTLIEVMIVIVIVGVVLAVAVMSMNVVGDKRQVKAAAAQLKTVIQTAEQEATLLPAVLRLDFSPTGYKFYAYRDRKWQSLRDDNLSRSHAFGSEVLVKVKRNKQNKKKHSMIIFSDSGDVEPFTILLTDKKHNVLYQVGQDQQGKLTLKNITGDTSD